MGIPCGYNHNLQTGAPVRSSFISGFCYPIYFDISTINQPGRRRGFLFNPNTAIVHL